MAGTGGVRLACVVIAAGLAAADCARCPEHSEAADALAHAAAFRKTRSLRELQGLLPALQLGLARQKVEEILGKPDYCPTDDQCYYASDSRSALGVPYGLVVDYRALNPHADRPDPPPGKLESFSLMAIAE